MDRTNGKTHPTISILSELQQVTRYTQSQPLQRNGSFLEVVYSLTADFI